jgi:hypothetical protein
VPLLRNQSRETPQSAYIPPADEALLRPLLRRAGELTNQGLNGWQDVAAQAIGLKVAGSDAGQPAWEYAKVAAILGYNARRAEVEATALDERAGHYGTALRKISEDVLPTEPDADWFDVLVHVACYLGGQFMEFNDAVNGIDELVPPGGFGQETRRRFMANAMAQLMASPDGKSLRDPPVPEGLDIPLCWSAGYALRSVEADLPGEVRRYLESL